MLALRKQLLKNFSNFLVRYSKSRMGIAGIILLLFFIIMALVAPLLTPYDPIYTMQLASFRAKPDWVDPSLPHNILLISDPSFTSSDSMKDWTLTASSPSVISWSSQEGYPGVTYIETGSGPGSLEISSNSLIGNRTVFVEKTFNYGYAPPRRFSAHIAYKVAVEGNAKWNIQILLKQPNGVTLLLWNSKTQIGSVDWAIPKPAIDTNDALFRFRLFQDILADATRIFPEKGDYSLILRVSNEIGTGSVNTYIDDFNGRIWGEAFGLLGTDNYGRDIFTQLVYGSRISIIIGIFSAVIAVLLGLLVGLVSGYLGGWIDELLMRSNDILLTIPGLPFLIVLAAVIGPSIWSVIILIGFLGWMGIARLIRSQVLSHIRRICLFHRIPPHTNSN